MYLLDTHALLWYLLGSDNISPQAKKIIDTNECFYSAASLWEIAIKQSLKRLEFNMEIQEIENQCKIQNFICLSVESKYMEQTKKLPFVHKDPFDRMLIAQAQVENLTIITKDAIIPNYDVKTLW